MGKGGWLECLEMCLIFWTVKSLRRIWLPLPCRRIWLVSRRVRSWLFRWSVSKVAERRRIFWFLRDFYFSFFRDFLVLRLLPPGWGTLPVWRLFLYTFASFLPGVFWHFLLISLMAVPRY